MECKEAPSFQKWGNILSADSRENLFLQKEWCYSRNRNSFPLQAALFFLFLGKCFNPASEYTSGIFTLNSPPGMLLAL